MPGLLLPSTFHVVIDDDGKSFRLLTHDLDAAEILWSCVLGSQYRTQTVIDPLLGSGAQFVILESTGSPPTTHSP